ncbi:MAG TPA: DUF488 domain-containing protein [Isosphaeraceae bacterium]|jgi:uncharacterized protein (DUF488 family)|nr:DUF488 domain-containing protein [Isosphaeraceae bacterium]
MPATFWTVGHSTRPIDEFLGLLRGMSIGLVADVRRFPGSRRYPHFNEDALAAALAGAGIGYRHVPGLGGRRGKRAPGSPNTAWRVEAFNAFADHMASAEFRGALDELIALAEDRRVAIMCSEAVPWRCHRRLIADALVARGHDVLDILGPGKADPHSLTPFARLVGDLPTYPAEPLFGAAEG